MLSTHDLDKNTWSNSSLLTSEAEGHVLKSLEVGKGSYVRLKHAVSRDTEDRVCCLDTLIMLQARGTINRTSLDYQSILTFRDHVRVKAEAIHSASRGMIKGFQCM
jgi:hypothetical protein